MQITHNLMAMNSNRMLGIVGTGAGKISEKLSSGYRINRAADDAAGLSISEKMRRQIRGLTQASANAQDGISLVQSAEGALNEMHEIVHRGNELAVKAANGTLTEADRELVDMEIQQLKQALNEAAGNTVFNEIQLFPENGLSPSATQAADTNHYKIKYNLLDGSFQVENFADAAEGVDGTGNSDEAGSVLADKIANVMIPNAIAQIFEKFESLQDAVGNNEIDMALDISYIDGASNTLAYAQCSFFAEGAPISFLIKVDSADFSDEDAAGNGTKAEMLESTIAHELMHSVMQYTMTDQMTGRDDAVEEFPDWFTEGVAQLTGGGFTTGWNSVLDYYADALKSADDMDMDDEITEYLNDYTVAERPYGHGYLASAYLGYLASGGTGDVTAESIAAGMDKIFKDMLSTMNPLNFSDAILKNTGLTETDIENLFANGDTKLVEFVRKLSYASKDGAGSVIATSLSTGGTDILGDTAPEQAFRVDPNQINVDMSSTGSGGTGGGGTGGGGTGNGATTLFIQVGAEAGIHIDISLFNMDAEALGLTDTNVKTVDAANNAIDDFKSAIESISRVRSYYGSIQNRLEHTINNLDNVIENTTAAESAIRDTDMAKTMVQYTSNNVLLQAGQAMLAQANRHPEYILGLLR